MEPMDPSKMFVFTPWWDSTTKVVRDAPPMIHEKLKEIRRKVGGLQARTSAGGPRFAVKSAKELLLKLREAIDATDCHCYVSSMTATPIETETGTAASVHAVIRVCAPDGSYIDCHGYGQGADRDDKAGGKASTYAWKDALVKGLSLPDAEMADTDDEEGVSPAKKGAARVKMFQDQITAAKSLEELKALHETLVTLDNDTKLKLSVAFNKRKKELGA